MSRHSVFGPGSDGTFNYLTSELVTGEAPMEKPESQKKVEETKNKEKGEKKQKPA